MIYIAVLCNSTESLQNRSTIFPLFIGSYAVATERRFSMKALARYQVILLGEQRHIRYEQLAQGLAGIMLRPELNPQPLDHKSDALPLYYRATLMKIGISIEVELQSRLESITADRAKLTRQ